ncbi:hypothetical protein QUB70_04995 [Microcoleus sp. A003_D6]
MGRNPVLIGRLYFHYRRTSWLMGVYFCNALSVGQLLPQIPQPAIA